MGSGLLVDLFSPWYWLLVAVATVAVAPWSSAAVRAWGMALVNLLFLTLVLGGKLLPVVAGLALAYVAMRVLARVRSLWLLGALTLAAAAIFVVHKRPDWASLWGFAGLSPVLKAIGFSYVVLRLFDMARSVCEGRRTPPSVPGVVNYLLPFHMLAAGPIQSYDEFCLQPAIPVRLTADESLVAFEWIAGGLFKKYVLAAFLERFLLTGFQSGGAYTLVEMQLNYVWLYLDFSGYSETAWGVGRLMGVATPVNFHRPLTARNSIEFWERWHISLSQFIRTHLFFPLQLALMRLTDGRRPLAIACVAFTVSFLACGLWHDLGWTWLVWGAWQAAGLVAVTLYKQILTDRLGRKGVKEYLTRPWIRRGAILLTFEFQAFAVLIVTYPFSW